jgi:hypothetical protein
MLARKVLGHLRRRVDGELVSNLFDPGGKPLGWAHHEERHVIREHLKRRGRYRQGWSELHISAIQRRLHRYDLTFRELQVLYKRKWAHNATPAPPSFDAEELARLLEHFEGGNDPVAQSIAAKAAALLTVQEEPLGEPPAAA